MNITRINRRLASAVGATVAAASVPALLLLGAGAAQAAPPAPMASHSLAQVRPGDLPLGPVDPQIAQADQALQNAQADYKAKQQAADAAQAALNDISNQYGQAVKAQAAAQERFNFDRKGPFWNSNKACIDNPASTFPVCGNLTVGQSDTEDLDAANQKVADLKPKVLADLATRNNTAAAAAQAKSALDAAAANDAAVHNKK
jgi:hypothetical protein